MLRSLVSPARAPFFRNLLVAAACGALLCACAQDAPHKPRTHAKKPKPPKPVYNAESYVQHLTRARLLLAAGEDAEAPLQALEAFAAKPPKKITQATVVALEYKLQGGGKQQALAPIIPPPAEFPALREVLEHLSLSSITLYDIHPYRVTVAPLPLDAAAADAAALDRAQQALLKTKRRLAPIDEARVQLQLTRFFLERRLRDGAYLAMDNAKQSLAAAAEKEAEGDTLKALTEEQAALEKRLHETLPFTLKGS